MCATSDFRRFLAVAFVLLAVCLVNSPAQAQYGGGIGTANDPYLIYTAEQLTAIGDCAEDWDKHFRLMANIDLDPNRPGGQVFDRAVIAPDINDTDISHQGPSFSGSLDGNGFVISNLTIVGHSYLGLFGVLASGAEVLDLGIVDANLAGTGKEIGIVVGCSGAHITNCHMTGSIKGGSVVGGLAGYSAGPVRDSFCDVTVCGGHRVGGLIGYKSSKGSVIGCHSAGTVCGGWYAGGLIGENYGRVSESYSTGSVNGSGRYVGGLIGVNGGRVTACYSAAAVCGGYHVGGLVGLHQWDLVTNCYSTGPVGGTRYVGGLLGLNTNEGRVSHCYSTGRVDGKSDFGGLVGESFLDSVVTEAFWDVETSGQTESAGGTGLTTARMMNSDTYLNAGWDFAREAENGEEGIWWILESRDYPRLGWQLLVDGAPVLVVDDFESYTDDVDAGEAIFQTWVVYNLDVLANGATVGHMFPPFAEQTIIHGGSQSMPFYYRNTNGVVDSRAERSFFPAQDWTANGADTLSLWFRGAADNGVDAFYLTVQDSAFKSKTLFNPDPNAVLVDTWTPWFIPLSDLTAAGVNTKSVRTLLIGVGAPDNPQPGGAGLIYIDDIHLTKAPVPPEPDLIIVDDFEGPYDMEREIFDVWIDGWANSTGSTVGYVVHPFVEQTIVHGGRQSMPLGYNNVETPYYSEAMRTWDMPQDWTISEADSLTLHFHGEADNDPENLYVAIEDRAGRMAVVTYPDADALLATEWQKWHIALADLKAAGVDVAAVKKMVIGIGDRDSPQPGGTGLIYIDDICLTNRMP